MLSEFAWDPRYRVSSLDDVLTLVVAPLSRIRRLQHRAHTLDLLGGDADRWRVHINDPRSLGYTLRMLVERRRPQFQMRDHSGNC